MACGKWLDHGQVGKGEGGVVGSSVDILCAQRAANIHEARALLACWWGEVILALIASAPRLKHKWHTHLCSCSVCSLMTARAMLGRLQQQ